MFEGSVRWGVVCLQEHAMYEQPSGREVNDTATAGVMARPPVLFLTALLLGTVLDRVLTLPLGAPEGTAVRLAISGLLILIGAAVTAAGIRDFSRAGTPVPTTEPTRVLVTTGAHGLSRNPIYIGMFLMYGGIGVGTRSPWALLLALPLAIVIRYGVVAREESYLERRFGDAYRIYRSCVRRWL